MTSISVSISNGEDLKNPDFTNNEECNEIYLENHSGKTALYLKKDSGLDKDPRYNDSAKRILIKVAEIKNCSISISNGEDLKNPDFTNNEECNEIYLENHSGKTALYLKKDSGFDKDPRYNDSAKRILIKITTTPAPDTETDEFGIVKIFADDPNGNYYKFRLGRWGEDEEDRDHFPGRTYGSCPRNDRNDPDKSVVSTEWEKDDLEFVDQEVTGYFYLPNREEESENKEECYKFEPCGKGSALSIKLRGGKHNNDNDSAYCYIFDFQYEGGDCKNYVKEAPHGYYKKKNAPIKFSLQSIMRKWVGLKAVTINRDNGVHCMAFVDFGSQGRTLEQGPDPGLQNWKMYYEVFDDGNLDHIPGERFDRNTKDPFLTHKGAKITQFRLDRIMRPEGKWLTARSVSAGRDDIDRAIAAH